MEDILNKLRRNEMVVTPDIMDVLLESLDVLKLLLDNVRSGESNENVDIQVAISHLEGAMRGGEATISRMADTTNEEGEEGLISEESTSEMVDASVVEETVQSLESATSPTPEASSPGKAKMPGSSNKSAQEQTIRVDVDRLDSLMNLMGELVLGRNSLMQVASDITAQHEGLSIAENLNRAAGAVNYITTELQMAVMRMRMQPVGKVFSKFPRLVRDLTRDSGKQIDLEIIGEETELDKSVIEEIGDPLVHCIRNSCDHGVESPEERIAAGKNPRGTVKLIASQEGSNIVIKVVDDGRGLDVNRIRAKAVERGLVNQADVDRMPDTEVFRFIFEAGFSTAQKITDISGRGVGMDVLRTNIEKLNGLIDLESTLGQGTSVIIKLPLTLAIVQGLLVESDKEVFILPMASVVETVKTDQSSIFYINQRPVLRLRGEVIPVINLNDILRESAHGFIMSEKQYIVVVGLAEKKLGINIDRFLGQEEVVIKSLSKHLGTLQGISGATILGDGRIRLIVDLIGLFHLTKKVS
jgi:two-component system chemotaxis sensor kinase CheA